MIAVDTSVAVAAFGEHVESYSVLTGFPLRSGPPPNLVAAWLDDRFTTILPVPATDEQGALVRELAVVASAVAATTAWWPRRPRWPAPSW